MPQPPRWLSLRLLLLPLLLLVILTPPVTAERRLRPDIPQDPASSASSQDEFDADTPALNRVIDVVYTPLITGGSGAPDDGERVWGTVEFGLKRSGGGGVGRFVKLGTEKLAEDVGGDSLVRIGGRERGNGETSGWRGGVVVRGDVLTNSNPHITLHVSPAGDVFHVEVSASSSTPGSTGASVSVLTTPLGPSPVLGKPVVVGPDGALPTAPVEKTFLQKYWWLLLGGALLLAGAGGGGE